MKTFPQKKQREAPGNEERRKEKQSETEVQRWKSIVSVYLDRAETKEEDK